MQNYSSAFAEIVTRRRACRLFDTEITIPNEVIKSCLEKAILSPNSSNMQLWEFYRIKTAEMKKEVARICLNQGGARTASEIIIFVARPDLWKKRQAVHLKKLEEVYGAADNKGAKKAFQYYNEMMPLFYDNRFPFFKDIFKRIYLWNRTRKKPFVRDILSKQIPIVVHKSVALAAQTFMLAISAEGFDSLPMEGFDSIPLKKLLNLPKEAQITMAIGVGKGKKEGIHGDRFRIPYEEVVFEV